VSSAGAGRAVVHDCTTDCAHGGPLFVRWPWRQEGVVLEDWPANAATHMPPGVAVSMGATVKLLARQASG
jgi:hypothetical protein